MYNGILLLDIWKEKEEEEEGGESGKDRLIEEWDLHKIRQEKEGQ